MLHGASPGEAASARGSIPARNKNCSKFSAKPPFFSSRPEPLHENTVFFHPYQKIGSRFLAFRHRRTRIRTNVITFARMIGIEPVQTP